MKGKITCKNYKTKLNSLNKNTLLEDSGKLRKEINTLEEELKKLVAEQELKRYNDLKDTTVSQLSIEDFNIVYKVLRNQMNNLRV